MSPRFPSNVRIGTIPRAPLRQPCFQFHWCRLHTPAPTFTSGISSMFQVGRSISSLTSIETLPIAGSGRLIRARPRHSLLSLAHRTFSTSRSTFIRQTYFPTPQGGRGGPPRGSLWRQWQRRIDGYPPIYIVRLNSIIWEMSKIPNHHSTQIYWLIGINVVIYLLWQYARESFVSRLGSEGGNQC